LDNRFLSPDDIVKMSSMDLIIQVIRGLMMEYDLFIGVMLDQDEDNTGISKRIGKIFITDETMHSQPSYCSLLRTHEDKIVSKKCSMCYPNHFESAKKKFLANPSYHKGEIYPCPGALWFFVVPIAQKESNSFLGVIFGGQKRVKESRIQAWKHLRESISGKTKPALGFFTLWNLYWNYLKVGKTTKEDLQELESKCETIATALVKPLELLVSFRKARLDKEMEQEATSKINELLIGSRNSKDFCLSMEGFLTKLQRWLLFDWAILLVKKKGGGGEEVFEVQSVVGRGVGPPNLIRDKQFTFNSDEVKTLEVQHNPNFLRKVVHGMVRGQPEWWWIPLVIESSVFGVIVLGSAPEHPNTEYDGQHIQDRIQRLKEIAGKIATKHSQLDTLERLTQKTKQLQESKAELTNTIKVWEDTLLGLTHQMGRPLIMMRAALSNVRDLYERASKSSIIEHVELGILAAKHAELLNRGIAKVFAVEMGGQFKYNPKQIDAKAKLKELSEAMQRLSGRKDILFEYFEESPIIKMDLDSFLYVFYVLIDNAIKYSDGSRTIQLGCDEERATGQYALKVKSFGLPIDDPSMVFKKFRRGRDAWRYDETGIGLGCWSAKEHMIRQEGDISVETQGNLSVFIVHPPK
jgi:signal transduction histidine kinase